MTAPLSPAGHAEASRWLDETPADQRGGRTLPALRERFGLSTVDAIRAIRDHNQRLARVI